FSLFNSGKADQAFSLINKLREEQPVEYRFYAARDSLLNFIRTRADEEFSTNNYSGSLHYLKILEKQEMPVRMETLRKRAICEYRIGEFRESLQALKHIYSQQPWNLEVLIEIATINMENLQNHEEALKYFSLGKELFKKNQTSIYGRAFELVMDP